MKRIFATGMLAVLTFSASLSINAEEKVIAPAAPRTVAGPHGGTLRQIDGLQAETIVTDAGIRVHLFDRDANPISNAGSRGVAAVRVAGGAKRYRYDLMPDETGGLTARINLAPIAGRPLTIDVQLVGVSGRNATNVVYTEVASVPLNELQLAAAAIARQKTCPVSGKPLGSMGDPVAVSTGDQRVFVCCAGCVDAVKANPGKYASGKPTVEIATVAAGDAALIAKQSTCPVMDEPLGSMGQPVKLLVAGKPLFLCCKGCVKKVQAEPAKYFTMIDGEKPAGSGPTVAGGTDAVRPGVFKATAADKPFIAAQKRCPVMDEALDAMGGPYQVNAAGKAIYICCPGCAKKIAAEPEKYLGMLNSQGVEAPVIK
ncbi:hypothetical protein [Rhodopirellula sp. P2]|uniref:hypothetical protein n=1 Tax=Rhodopirellula sp. P2 TaxID=2127060 RepID=UPI002368EB96|nr:hypothetical protein [Rhodopirellula sp. P2]WDQ18085.1 hypothetical protein PSR62_05905 [Rhodopirellula sp. P2]